MPDLTHLLLMCPCLNLPSLISSLFVLQELPVVLHHFEFVTLFQLDRLLYCQVIYLALILVYIVSVCPPLAAEQGQALPRCLQLVVPERRLQLLLQDLQQRLQVCRL